MNTPRKHTKRPFRRRKSARPSFLSRVLQFGAYLLVFALGGCYLRVASHGGSWPFRTEASDAVDKLGRHVGGLQRKFGGLGSQGFQVLESEKGDQHNQVNKGGQKQSESIQGDHQIEEAVIQRADQREKKLQEEQDALGVDTSDEADNGLWEGDSTAERESAVQASEERNNKGFKRSFQLPSRRRQKASGLVSRVAVGSCTARTDIPQPVWEQAVIPSEPDAWIW